MSHTPGPWRLGPWYDRHGHANPNRYSGIFQPIPNQALGSRECILSVGFKGAEVDDAWLSMRADNARLIELAPELLEALKGATGNLRMAQVLMDSGSRALCQSILKDYEALIARATCDSLEPAKPVEFVHLGLEVKA